MLAYRPRSGGGFHRSPGLGAAPHLSIVSLGNILDPQISGCAFECTSYDLLFLIIIAQTIMHHSLQMKSTEVISYQLS